MLCSITLRLLAGGEVAAEQRSRTYGPVARTFMGPQALSARRRAIPGTDLVSAADTLPVADDAHECAEIVDQKGTTWGICSVQQVDRR